MPLEAPVQPVQLLQVAAGGGDQERGHVTARAGSSPSGAPPARGCCGCCARLEAPKTIDSMLGCAQTHSIASRGGIAPEAKTDIATAPEAALAQRLLVGLDAAAHAEADLVDVRADDRVLDAELARARRAARQVHRDEARLGVVAARARGRRRSRKASLKPRPSSRSTIDVLQEDHRRVAGPANIFISASISSVRDALDVLAWPATTPPRIAASKSALLGQEPLAARRACRPR